MENYVVPGLMEAAACAINNNDWIPVRTLLEGTLAEDSVEYTQLQQIHVNENIIRKACSSGFTKLVWVFLNNGFQANSMVNNKSIISNKSSHTRMLHLASLSGHLSLVELLLKNGANVDCETSTGDTPLYCAVHRGHLDVVEHLINAGADVNACDLDDFIEEYSIESFVDEEKEIAKLLLNSGYRMKTIADDLYWAVWVGNIKRVKSFLDAGAHINGMDTNIPLHEAASNGSIPMMQLLLEYGAEINARDTRGNTALYKAVGNGKLSSVKFLIDHGSFIDSVNKRQETPLMLSINLRHFDIAMLLINSGADLDLDIHHMLLHRGILLRAPIQLIKYLLEHVSTEYYYDETFLQDIIYNDGTLMYRLKYYNWNLHVAKLLLNYGLDHFVEDRYGNTVLHFACGMGDVELVEYLIDYGLNVDAKNRQGKKPIDIAHENGHPAIVNIIMEYHCNKYTSFD